jgi:hypothetical protein
MNPLCLQI